MQSCSGRGFHLLGLGCCQGHSGQHARHMLPAARARSQPSPSCRTHVLPQTRGRPPHAHVPASALLTCNTARNTYPISPACTHHPQTHAPSGGAWARPYSQPAATLFCIHTQLCTPARATETFEARRRSLEMWGNLGRRGRGDLSCAVSQLDSTGCVHSGK